MAITTTAASVYWYHSNQSGNEGVAHPIDEKQWTNDERIDFAAARRATDRWLASQGFESVSLAETSAKAKNLASGLDMKKAPFDKQTWYRSPDKHGEPFHVVTFAQSAPTQWEDVRAEYFGCFVVWDYSGFRWNVDEDAEVAMLFAKQVRDWWNTSRTRSSKP